MSLGPVHTLDFKDYMQFIIQTHISGGNQLTPKVSDQIL